MIKYSVVDTGDETVRSEVQIEGNVKLLIVEFGRIAEVIYIRRLSLVRNARAWRRACL